MQIDIALVTWPNHPKRWLCFRETLASLRKHLTATGHTIRYVCSSESELDPKHEWFGDELVELCEARGMELSFRDGKPGLGENMNAALRMCSGDFVLLVQDDRPLLKPLDLAESVEYMHRNQAVDIVRFSWPGGRVRLMIHPDMWRRFDILGPWPYGDDPHLRRHSFTQKWGEYREAIRHGGSEGIMLHHLKDGNALIVAADDIYFGHSGAGVPAVVNDARYPGRDYRGEWQALSDDEKATVDAQTERRRRL